MQRRGAPVGKKICMLFLICDLHFCHFSKLDTDHLYMAYADIMAKVSHRRRC